jgi:prephenate dehydrogenase
MTTLGIIGTGLIGGSIGMRARELGWRVIGYDVREGAAEQAVQCGAIDEAVPRDAIDERADVIAIAAHISGTIAELQRMRFTQPRNARLIIDIASVKAPVVRAARGLQNFVATHPMAGRERSGPSAAARDLFEGKTWLYVPTGDRELDWRAVEFIGALGANPVEISACQHDDTVAFTSHLPQILATLFSQRLRHGDAQPRHGDAQPRHGDAQPRHGDALRCHGEVQPCHPEVSKDGRGIEAFMGPTARELMRLSRSSAPMWHDILDANKENICTELRALASELARVADALERGENLYASSVTVERGESAST